MPLTATCSPTLVDAQSLLDISIDLPGGVSLQSFLESGSFPDLASVIASVIRPLNSAMTPLVPIFRILNVVLAIVDAIKAIPGALGPPPNPGKLVSALAKLAKAVAALSDLLPPLSIPLMVVSTLKVIALALNAVVVDLELQVNMLAKINTGQALATVLSQDPDLVAAAALLMANLDCAASDVDQMTALGLAGLGPIGKLLDLLSLFASLAGIEGLPTIDVSGGTAAELIAPLQAISNVLTEIAGSIPT